MRLDVVDTYVAPDGLMEGMAGIATGHLARSGDPYIMFLETDTWQSLVGRIIARVRQPRTLDLLQIHSHGTPGTMFSGRLNEHSAQEAMGIFRQVAPYFAPAGQVFLKGCETGQAPALLRPLARAFGVPVTAGIEIQFAGGPTHDVYVGRTVTATPDGMMHLDRPGIPRQTHP